MSDFNSGLPVRTETPGDVIVKIADATVTSQQLAIDSSGRTTAKLNDGAGNALASSTATPIGTEQALITRNIPSGTQPVSGTVAATQSGIWTQRLQDGAGNAITSTAAGATRPLDTILRDAAGVAQGSAVNPLVVTVSPSLSGAVSDYATASAVAGGATTTHTYTVTLGKTLLLGQIEATSSGKSKIEVQIETGVATNVFTTKFVQFNSTGAPNMSIVIKSPISVIAGIRVKVIQTNKDIQAQDLYSTILGLEV